MQSCSSSANPALHMPSLKSHHDRAETRRCAVVNANYEKVTATLDRLLRDERFTSACRCEKCLSDAAALALNYLPPHYYVDAGRGGEIGSPAVMVEGAVIEAIHIVATNPRHQKS